MSYTEDDIRLIDERIRLARLKERGEGTLITRDTTGSGATATILPSTTPVEVKVAGGVSANPGDRVLLQKHGSDWVITESFSSSSFGEAYRAVELSGTTGALTSASFVDLSEFGTFPFTKGYDLTFVRVGLSATAYTSGSAGQTAKVHWAVRLTAISGGIGYTPTDYSLLGININPLATHTPYSSARRVTTIPAGTYTVTLRWRRVSGAASVLADTNDSYMVELDEQVRAGVPIL